MISPHINNGFVDWMRIVNGNKNLMQPADLFIRHRCPHVQKLELADFGIYIFLMMVMG